MMAGRVKEMAPWDWMMEDEVFGVQNPESDEIGFISVMGAAGEHFAVALYPGANALYDFLHLHEAGVEGLAADIAPDRVLEIPQLQASFENRDQLDKEDREVIKKLNLKFRRANNWPQFRSYAPGMFPWFLTSCEARFLTAALEMELMMLPMREKKGWPFFPYLLLITDAESGLVLGTDMLEPLPSLDAMRAGLPLKLAENMSRYGVVPRSITVRTETTAQLLTSLAAELGIQLNQLRVVVSLGCTLSVSVVEGNVGIFQEG